MDHSCSYIAIINLVASLIFEKKNKLMCSFLIKKTFSATKTNTSYTNLYTFTSCFQKYLVDFLALTAYQLETY